MKYAYEQGAGDVEVEFRDDKITHMHYMYQSAESLSQIPDWIYDREKDRQEKGCCYLNVASAAPGGLKDIDPAKLDAYQRAYSLKMHDFSAYTMNNEGQWCVTRIPSAEWAKVVFADLNEQEAFDKLEELIFKICRIDEDSDPIEAWKNHDHTLISHAEKLTDYQFKALHFTSELGTDLTVEIVRDHIWVGGGGTTPSGVYFDPNIPTEECFCMPLKTGTNGIVYASRPLSKISGSALKTERSWNMVPAKKRKRLVSWSLSMRDPVILAKLLWCRMIRRSVSQGFCSSILCMMKMRLVILL